MRVTFTCCPSLEGCDRKGGGVLLFVSWRARIRDKFTPCCSEIISHLYLFLDAVHPFPQALWMCDLEIISLPFTSGLLGLTPGIWLHASKSRKFAFLFQEIVFQESQKKKKKNQMHCTCKSFFQKQNNSKITQACTKINVKFIRLFSLFWPFHWRYLATENSSVYKWIYVLVVRSF